MALIRLPGGAQQSGSTGGTTYSRNRFGAYARARSVPVNPNTDRQVAIRNYMRALSIAWNADLTPAERAAWIEYADNVPWSNKLGDGVSLTGLNMFVRSNVLVLQAGGARVDAAPVIFELAAAELSLAVTASEAAQELSVAFDDTQAWCSEDGAFQLVYMGIPKNASTGFFNGPWRFVDSIDGDSGTPVTSPQALAAPYVFAEGQRVWVRTRIVRADARVSEFAQVNFLAGA